MAPELFHPAVRRLDSMAHEPLFQLRGLHDTIVLVEWAHKLYAAVGSKKKFLKVITPEDGDSEHCHGDNRIVGSNYVADWLADNL